MFIGPFQNHGFSFRFGSRLAWPRSCIDNYAYFAYALRASGERTEPEGKFKAEAVDSKNGHRGWVTHLDSWDDALLLDQLNKRCSVVALLVQGLMEEDDSADVVADGGVCGEEELAVQTAILLGVLHVDVGKSLTHGPYQKKENKNGVFTRAWFILFSLQIF